MAKADEVNEAKKKKRVTTERTGSAGADLRDVVRSLRRLDEKLSMVIRALQWIAACAEGRPGAPGPDRVSVPPIRLVGQACYNTAEGPPLTRATTSIDD